MNNKEQRGHGVSEALTLPNFIAGNLKVLRKAAGWSQTELARRLELNRGNIASYECGAAEPNICKTLRISKLFEVSPRDLIRKDLGQPAELALARSAFAEGQDEERRRLAHSRNRALELTELLRASRSLFEHRRDNNPQPCREAESVSAHYQNLYDLAETILQEHRTLLNDLGCQCE